MYAAQVISNKYCKSYNVSVIDRLTAYYVKADRFTWLAKYPQRMCGAVLLRAVRADSIIWSCLSFLGEWEPWHEAIERMGFARWCKKCCNTVCLNTLFTDCLHLPEKCCRSHEYWWAVHLNSYPCYLFGYEILWPEVWTRKLFIGTAAYIFEKVRATPSSQASLSHSLSKWWA